MFNTVHRHNEYKDRGCTAQYFCDCFFSEPASAAQMDVLLCFAVDAENKTTYFNVETLDLTSRRKRGLSGMKMTPTSAASAGKRHTRINNLQLCIWNSVPMAKPQPGKKKTSDSFCCEHNTVLYVNESIDKKHQKAS